MGRPLADISCEVKQVRDKAIAVADGTTEEHEGRERLVWYWLPLSAIEVDPGEYDVGDTVTVTMPESLAMEKGLI